MYARATGGAGAGAQETRVLHEPHDVRVVHAVGERPLREPVPLGARLAVHREAQLRVLVLTLLQVIHHLLRAQHESE